MSLTLKLFTQFLSAAQILLCSATSLSRRPPPAPPPPQPSAPAAPRPAPRAASRLRGHRRLPFASTGAIRYRRPPRPPPQAGHLPPASARVVGSRPPPRPPPPAGHPCPPPRAWRAPRPLRARCLRPATSRAPPRAWWAPGHLRADRPVTSRPRPLVPRAASVRAANSRPPLCSLCAPPCSLFGRAPISPLPPTVRLPQHAEIRQQHGAPISDGSKGMAMCMRLEHMTYLLPEAPSASFSGSSNNTSDTVSSFFRDSCSTSIVFDVALLYNLSLENTTSYCMTLGSVLSSITSRSAHSRGR
ncbi:formin-like protein 14 isoform X1 [Panicum hallii]|uniref:formin-like protein 14 isoform X1 n=1 Tax=Panicum hallii TaxID=206008 RepID=UPI000DF4D291|nr:formin-like protein 14 isoform X1 [Panicum hallii]